MLFRSLAPYFVEEVRRYLEKTYGTSAVHESGLKVYSTLNVDLQEDATAAVRQGLRDYDKRHGWRGPQKNLLGKERVNLESLELPEWKLPIRTNDIVPGIVLGATAESADIRIASYRAQLRPADIAWTNSKSPGEILKAGDVALFMVRSMSSADRKMELSLEQQPVVQGALVAIEPQTGEIKIGRAHV